MKNHLILRVLLSMFLISAALHTHGQITLTNASSIKLKDYLVLPDSGYSFNEILKDRSLVFKSDSISASVSDIYWVKLVIHNPYPNEENYLISLSQPLNYTLFYVKSEGKNWESQKAGLNSPNRQRFINSILIVLKPLETNVLYIKLDLRDIKQYGYTGKPVVIMEKEVTFNAEERFIKLFFYICCIALIAFSCYNFYIYIQLKDKAYLYYVIVQIGALVFFVGDNLYMNVLFRLRMYSIIAEQNGRIVYYSLNDFAEHIGVAVIFWGFIQFTRSYLGVKATFPFLDKLLNFLSYTYVILEAVPALVTITGIYYLNMAIIDNIFILIIIATCLSTASIASLRKIKVARHFLLANLPPATFTIAASSHILLYQQSSPIFPTLAILSQIFTFAVALVARIKFINNDLNSKAEEAMQLKMEMTSAAYERLLMEQKNLHMALMMELEQEKNELLQQKLEANQRTLAGNSLHLHQKTKLLSDLKTQLQNIDVTNPLGKPEILRNIKSSLKDNQYLDENWDDFKLHFEQVHPSFFENLTAAHPSLTPYELRLYAYFHINLSTKEIATLLNIAPASVRQAKTRLLKKTRSM